MIASVTWVLLSLATIRPPLSSTATTGCDPNATPAVELEGDVVTASFVAAPKMSIAEPVPAATVSRDVRAVKPAAAYVAAPAFVIPAIVSEAAALFPSAQLPPLSARVIVTVVPALVAVAEQFVKPLGKVIVGVAGIVKPAGKTVVMASPAASAPEALAVKATVHVALAPAARVEAENVTGAGDVAAAIVMAAAGLRALCRRRF